MFIQFCSAYIIAIACRFKIIASLMKQFKTPRAAGEHYFHTSPPLVQPHPKATANVQVQTNLTTPLTAVATTQTDPRPSNSADVIGSILSELNADSQIEVMSKLFSKYISTYFNLDVPEDFLSLAAKSMAQLKCSKRSNVLYNLAKGIGTPRADGSDSRLPTRRMPMGIVEHIANFFVAEKMRKVRWA